MASANAEDLRQTPVFVTGSHMRGVAETNALPVDVITAEDLALESYPGLTSLIRELGVSSGVDGITNQFSSNGLEGVGNFNLHGLGPGRTLVLINGRRQVFSPFEIAEQAQLFVDTGILPIAAIERIEILKDGAAALYGSDAMAGVVNIITKPELDGFHVRGSYQTFEGSDGEYDVALSYGLQKDRLSWETSLAYAYRSEVPLTEKDWAVRPYADNPVGGWSSVSNPGFYIPLGIVGGGVAPVAGPVSDAGCEAVGGSVVGTCRYQYTFFDNLVEEEERYQLFSELTYDLTTHAQLYFEGEYAHTGVEEWKTAPSYPPQKLLSQFVSASHPGFQQYLTEFPGAFPASTIGALFIGRTFGAGGASDQGYGPQQGVREYDHARFVSGLRGDFDNGIGFDASITWAETEGYRQTTDTLYAALGAALAGYGVCADPVTGAVPAGAVPGQNGCEYYNPFSNAIPTNLRTGEANPYFNPALENSAKLADWMTAPTRVTVTTELLVLDGLLSGEGADLFGNGALNWAFGAQYRHEGYEVAPDALTNVAITPGVSGFGPFSFLAGREADDLSQDIWAVFGEVDIPVSDTLQMQAALRYEDYGGDVGGSLDPKLAGKWQISSDFAMRGSVQTSFRGPTLNQRGGVSTSLQYVAPTSAFKAVDLYGNPDLKPESAFSYNLGVLFAREGLSASLDYYQFDFEDPIIAESQSAIVDCAIAAISNGDLSAPILSRISFADPANMSASQIERVSSFIVNGPDILTRGLDLRIENVFAPMNGLVLTLGADASYVLEYEVGAYEIEGIEIAGGELAGQFNRTNFSRSLPELKANAYLNVSRDNQNFRAVLRYISDYEDERGRVTAAGAFLAPDDPAFESVSIEDQLTLDLFYAVSLPHAVKFSAAITNVFDGDPPFSQFDTNFDPYTHNPLGRTFRLSLSKTFGGK